MRLLAILSATLVSTLVAIGCGDDGSGGSGGGGGSAGGGDAGGEGGSTPDDLAPLSDTFDGTSLDESWQAFNDPAFDATVADGELSIDLIQAALWFDAGQGALLYKEVTGDFSVTASVRARKTSAPDDPPDANIHLGGLMARDPASDGETAAESYVFIVVGMDEDDVSVETKSTMDDESDYIGPTWPSTDAELRLCRVGASFHLYKREIGASEWEEAMVYERTDMPDTLQVGPNAYSLTAPDLTVHFGEVTFARVTSVDDCTR